MRQMANREMKNLSPVHSDPPSRRTEPEFIILASSWQAVRLPGNAPPRRYGGGPPPAPARTLKIKYHQTIRGMKIGGIPAAHGFLVRRGTGPDTKPDQKSYSVMSADVTGFGPGGPAGALCANRRDGSRAVAIRRRHQGTGRAVIRRRPSGLAPPAPESCTHIHKRAARRHL
jgi:hypothetical protein